MSHEPEITPSEPELELASDLAHYISIQAEGTRDSERLWIYAAARQIERLLSGSATQIDFAGARSRARRARTAARGEAPRRTAPAGEQSGM